MKSESSRWSTPHPFARSSALVEALEPEPEERRFRPPRELLIRIAMKSGNAWGARLELLEEGFWLPSYPTVMRALAQEDAGMHLALAKGMDAFERYLTVGRFEADHRNELCYMDAMHVAVRCRDKYGTRIEDLNLLSTFDAYSRAFPSHRVTIGAPSAADAVEVFIAAVLGRSFTRAELDSFLGTTAAAAAKPTPGIDPERPFLLGGMPEALLTDNGSIFTADEFKDGVRPFVTGAHRFGRAYIAIDKAKQERAHRTLQQSWMCDLPGYLDGPRPHEADVDAWVGRSPSGRRAVEPYSMPPDHALPRVEAVIEAIDAIVDDYNRNHVVSTTGQTPYGRWFSDQTPLDAILPITLWSRLPSEGTYTVQPSGVNVDGDYWQSTLLGRVTTRDIEVRGLRGQPERLFIGNDHYLDEVHRHPDRTEDERRADGVSNAIRGRRLRSLLRAAGDRLIDEGTPADQVPTGVRSRQEKRGGKARLGDPEAAAAATWNGSDLREAIG